MERPAGSIERATSQSIRSSAASSRAHLVATRRSRFSSVPAANANHPFEFRLPEPVPAAAVSESARSSADG